MPPIYRHAQHLAVPHCSSAKLRTLPRYRVALWCVACALLPAMLCPTHPVAVYGYILATYLPVMGPVYARSGDELATFLVSPDQVARYEEELLLDMEDTTSGRLFAITQGPDGQLRHSPVRTWNGLLPDRLPQTFRTWLDRKEFPFLGDEVALWQQGRRIVAMGHYHVFGGGPSPGDVLAQQYARVPEVVVSNGIVPLIYLEGALLPYGDDVVVTTAVFRPLRTLERAITMSMENEVPIPAEPGPALKSFLAYLRDHRSADISRLKVVADQTYLLSRTFQSRYSSHFEQGYFSGRYPHNPDKARFVQNLSALFAWCSIYRLDVYTEGAERGNLEKPAKTRSI